MASSGSVTHWIGALKSGDQQAAQQLWERYWKRLVGLAARKLTGARRQTSDEEDIAQVALKSFFLGAREGRFPQLQDRHDLWALLVRITANKAVDKRIHDKAQKRGGGQTIRSIDPTGDSPWDENLEPVIGNEPTPEFALQITEEYERLLAVLPDRTLRQIATWKMERYTHDEIAEKLGCVRRTVQRRLLLIQQIWTAQQESIQNP
ncbi:MAG: ECF-type sigma factor [Planctomycetota bacterium]|nr:ECF-type sigma factor [Planctomycetota bacterium]